MFRILFSLNTVSTKQVHGALRCTCCIPTSLVRRQDLIQKNKEITFSNLTPVGPTVHSSSLFIFKDISSRT